MSIYNPFTSQYRKKSSRKERGGIVKGYVIKSSIFAKEPKTRMMKKYLLLLFASVTIVSCFPTEVWIPVFDNTTATDFIPANKYELVIPFRFDTYTKTSRPKEVYQFKCLLTVGDDVTEYGPGEVSWQWNWWDGHSCPDALLYLTIPANNTGSIRPVTVEVSIDELYNSSFSGDEDDTHQWGEWQIIYTGQQACFD